MESQLYSAEFFCLSFRFVQIDKNQKNNSFQYSHLVKFKISSIVYIREIHLKDQATKNDFQSTPLIRQAETTSLKEGFLQ